MKRYRLTAIWFITIIFLIMLLFIPQVSAGEDANIDEDLIITATPSQQGIGGKITLNIFTTFYGGCCYPLFAFDVQPELILPDNIDLVDNISPEKISKFEATAGGGAVLAKFQCTLRSFVPGEYEIPVKVSTSNCGVAEGKVKITVTEGCVISIPDVYPNQPSTGRDINIKVSAYSPIEGINIENVSLYYILSSSDILKNPKPKEDILNWSNGNEKGQEIIFRPVEFEEYLWQVDISKQNEESFLTYWIVAKDNFGNKTTSPVYTFEIKNLEKIHLQHSGMIWATIITSILGTVMIGVTWKYVSLNPKLKTKPSGVLLIGGTAVDIVSSESEKLNFQNKKNNIRNFALLIILICALILIFVAIQSELYELLRTNVGG